MNENIAAVVFEDVGMSGGPWGFFFFFLLVYWWSEKVWDTGVNVAKDVTQPSSKMDTETNTTRQLIFSIEGDYEWDYEDSSRI